MRCIQRILVFSLVAGCAVLSALPASAAPFKPGEVVFLLPPENANTSGRATALASQRVSDIFQRHAIRQVERLDRGTVVVLFPDGGSKYLSTRLFDDPQAGA